MKSARGLVRPPRNSGIVLMTASIAAIDPIFALPRMRTAPLAAKYEARITDSNRVMLIQYLLGRRRGYWTLRVNRLVPGIVDSSSNGRRLKAEGKT